MSEGEVAPREAIIVDVPEDQCGDNPVRVGLESLDYDPGDPTLDDDLVDDSLDDGDIRLAERSR